MPVTQNYTITMSSDAWLATVAAVLTSVRDDRRELDRMPLMPGWAEWINSEIKLKSEALGALNLAKILTREDTHGALEGEKLKTVLFELRTMREMLAGHMVILTGRPERLGRLTDALLFLEGQK